MVQEILTLINSGALFVINHSGGKDSQAMTILLSKMIPAKQLVIIHAHLGEVEWQGVKEHIEANSCSIPVHYTEAKKTLFEMVEHRQMFPSPSNRQCTSDLKRGPIQRFINNYAKQNLFYQVVNCMGLRAEESNSRAKKETFRARPDLSSRHREQYEWLPIHHYTLEQVWQTIKEANQEPHWAYKEGMSRLSCCFCIMASNHDLKIAAKLNPELFNRYVETEKRLGFTLSMSKKPLTQIVSEP